MAANGPGRMKKEKEDMTPATSTSYSCSSCCLAMVETSTYRCSECFGALDASSTENQVLCENCILVHIRKRHEVIDCKGYSPKVCEKHQNLCLMYCSECETVFCFHCLGPHCKHDYTLVFEKASEVRKEIFNYLDRFEKLSKSMAFRETDVLNIAKHNEDLYPGMKPEHLNEFLTKKFANVLKTNQAEWANLINWDKELHTKHKSFIETVKNVNGRAGGCVADLRKLLSLSDGVCVSSFLDSKLNFDASIKEQNSELEVHTVQTWCNSLDNLIKYSIESALKAWEFQNINRRRVILMKVGNGSNYVRMKNYVLDFKRKNFPAILVSSSTPTNASGYHSQKKMKGDNTLRYVDFDSFNELLDLSITKKSININSLVLVQTRSSGCANKSTTEYFWREEKFSIDCNNKSVYVFRYGNEMAIVNKFSGDLSVSLYNLDAYKVPNQSNGYQSEAYSNGQGFGNRMYPGINSQSQRDAPQKLILTERFNVDGNVTPLAFVRSSSSINRSSFSVVFWSSTDGSLHFQPEKPKFPCESKPSAIHYTETMLAFAENCGTVTIVDLESRLSVKVRPVEHGMKKVNNLRFFKIDGNKKKGLLVMFDYTEKLCVLFGFDLESLFNLKFSMMNVCRFDVPSSETVSLMTLLCGNVIIITEDNIYPAGLPFRDDGHFDEAEFYQNVVNSAQMNEFHTSPFLDY